MTSWDARALARALAATCVAFLIGWLVTAASDEGGLTVGARAGRTVPLLPLFSSVGAAIAVGGRRTRQEIRALATLGRSPLRSAAIVAVGAAAPAIGSALVLALVARADVSAFYPSPQSSDRFSYADGAFVSDALGARVDVASGAIALGPPQDGAGEPGLPRGGRSAAAAAMALAALALSLLAARTAIETAPDEDRATSRRRIARAGAAIAVTALTTTLGFQAAAAGAVTPWAAAIPPITLLAFLGRRYQREHA